MSTVKGDTGTHTHTPWSWYRAITYDVHNAPTPAAATPEHLPTNTLRDPTTHIKAFETIFSGYEVDILGEF